MVARTPFLLRVLSAAILGFALLAARGAGAEDAGVQASLEHFPRITNGALTQDFPAVGALLKATTHCQLGYAHDWMCSDDVACHSSGTCTDGVCRWGILRGSNCTNNAECSSSGTCDPASQLCQLGLRHDLPCLNDSHCSADGSCVAGACIRGYFAGDACTGDADCSSSGTCTGAVRFRQVCTGTMIGCRAFLTAAHCVCGEDGGDCQPGQLGAPLPGEYRVFLPHSGILEPVSIAVHPDYTKLRNQPVASRTRGSADLAAVTLGSDATGIRPSQIPPSSSNAARVAIDRDATLTGYGFTRPSGGDNGIKRHGTMVTAACPAVVSAESLLNLNDTQHVCWMDSPGGGVGENVGICNADSGGPVYMHLPEGGRRVVAVNSGGLGCGDGFANWGTNARHYRNWIVAAVGAGNLSPESCSDTFDAPDSPGRFAEGPQGSDADCGPTVVRRIRGQLGTHIDLQQDHQFTVPFGATQLRVALNAEERQPTTPGFDLYLRRDVDPAFTHCSGTDATQGQFEYCEFEQPHVAGLWHLSVRKPAGTPRGDYQVTVTALVPSGFEEASTYARWTVVAAGERGRVVLRPGATVMDSVDLFATTGQGGNICSREGSLGQQSFAVGWTTTSRQSPSLSVARMGFANYGDAGLLYARTDATAVEGVRAGRPGVLGSGGPTIAPGEQLPGDGMHMPLGIDTTGSDPDVCRCLAAQRAVLGPDRWLDWWTHGVEPQGRVRLRSRSIEKANLILHASEDGGMNVFRYESIHAGNFTNIVVSGFDTPSPDTRVLIVVDRYLRLDAQTNTRLLGGLTADRVMFYVRGARSKIGRRHNDVRSPKNPCPDDAQCEEHGATIYAPDGRIRMRGTGVSGGFSYWNGALYAGAGGVVLESGARLRHAPFRWEHP